MIPNKDIAGLMNAAYYGFNRALANPDGSRGDFQPYRDPATKTLTTYCNQFIQYICAAIGYTDFSGMNANEMIDFMKKPGSGWMQLPVDGVTAQSHANLGVIVLGAKSNPDGHGHVCLVVPGVLEKSYSWGSAVPKCVNVGKDVFFGKKISFAFSADGKCDYFALSKMI